MNSRYLIFFSIALLMITSVSAAYCDGVFEAEWCDSSSYLGVITSNHSFDFLAQTLSDCTVWDYTSFRLDSTDYGPNDVYVQRVNSSGELTGSVLTYNHVNVLGSLSYRLLSYNNGTAVVNLSETLSSWSGDMLNHTLRFGVTCHDDDENTYGSNIIPYPVTFSVLDEGGGPTPPTYTSFDGATTDFSTGSDDVSQPVLEKVGSGKIVWDGSNLDFSANDFDSYVTMGAGWVSVDSANLGADVNTSAVISIYGEYSNPLLYMDGMLCGVDCVLLSSNATMSVFSVNHFTNYSIENGSFSLVSPANDSVLSSIWTPFIVDVNSSSSGTCELYLDSVLKDSISFVGSGQYNLSNWTYLKLINDDNLGHSWYVVCNGTQSETRTFSVNVITETTPSAPGWVTYAGGLNYHYVGVNITANKKLEVNNLSVYGVYLDNVQILNSSMQVVFNESFASTDLQYVNVTGVFVEEGDWFIIVANTNTGAGWSSKLWSDYGSNPLPKDYVNIEIVDDVFTQNISDPLFSVSNTGSLYHATLNSITTTSISCVPNWSCFSFSACNPSNVSACLSVTDGNSCGELFGGNLSTYDDACVYVPPVTTEEDDLSTIALHTIITLMVIFVLLGFLDNLMTRKTPQAEKIFHMIYAVLGIVALLAVLALLF